MPITYQIDHVHRIVDARAQGILNADDMFQYQREVWSRPEVAGYQEIVDMTEVIAVEGGSVDGMHQLAAFSARTDSSSAPSRFAIVAVDDLHYGLGRMYQAIRESTPANTREIRVFRERTEALRWLGVTDG